MASLNIHFMLTEISENVQLYIFCSTPSLKVIKNFISEDDLMTYFKIILQI